MVAIISTLGRCHIFITCAGLSLGEINPAPIRRDSHINLARSPRYLDIYKHARLCYLYYASPNLAVVRALYLTLTLNLPIYTFSSIRFPMLSPSTTLSHGRSLIYDSFNGRVCNRRVAFEIFVAMGVYHIQLKYKGSKSKGSRYIY